jgi:hypothetical protein
MKAFSKLSIVELEAFIEKNSKYEKLMPEMLTDAKVALLGRYVEEKLKYEAHVSRRSHKW